MKKKPKPQGSILIWTVLLGVILSLVFFFFSQRLNLNVALQRKSIEKNNQIVLLESYANYLMHLDQETLKSLPNTIEFEGITGELINETHEIKGMLDVNENMEFKINGGRAQIEFNFCGHQEKGRILDITNTESIDVGQCGNAAYDGLAISNPNTTFTLSTGEAPVSYRISPFDENALIESHQWNLVLNLAIPGQAPLHLERNFETNPL